MNGKRLIGLVVLAAATVVMSPAITAKPVESRLEIITIATGERTIVYRAPVRFEAPNWSPDGQWLIFNQEGRLFAIAPDGSGAPKELQIGGLRDCNNDHGLSPDGTRLAASCSGPGDRSAVYVLPFAAPGTKAAAPAPRLLTQKTPSYWHGWSPDAATLAYVAERNGEFDIYTVSVSGGEERRLTTAPGLDDGPDYTPDGRWIYFNSERSGVMRIWRMRPDGSGQEQVTRDQEYADWFPHPSPDGRWIVFLSYKSDVKGHPPDHDVVLRLMPADGGAPKVVGSLLGGQGTINVPSWSPDSRSFAFVSYELRAQGDLMPVRNAVDHLILGVSDLDQGIAWVERLTGVRAAIGGSHPGRGTRNALLSCGNRQYMEIIAPDPAQVGPVRRADLLALENPRLIGWAAAATDLESLSTRGRDAGQELAAPRAGSRIRPDGRTLSWRTLNLTHQLAANGVDPIPFFIQWSADSVHPSQDAPAGCALESFEIEHPNPAGVSGLLQKFGIAVTAAPAQAVKLIAVLQTPKGRVRLE